MATVDLEGTGLGAGLTLDPGMPSSFGGGFKSPCRLLLMPPAISSLPM